MLFPTTLFEKVYTKNRLTEKLISAKPDEVIDSHKKTWDNPKYKYYYNFSDDTTEDKKKEKWDELEQYYQNGIDTSRTFLDYEHNNNIERTLIYWKSVDETGKILGWFGYEQLNFLQDVYDEETDEYLGEEYSGTAFDSFELYATDLNKRINPTLVKDVLQKFADFFEKEYAQYVEWNASSKEANPVVLLYDKVAAVFHVKKKLLPEDRLYQYKVTYELWEKYGNDFKTKFHLK